jgi:hypothetical protein
MQRAGDSGDARWGLSIASSRQAVKNFDSFWMRHEVGVISRCFREVYELALFRSRDSPFLTSFPPIFQAHAALCVQNDGVLRKVIQDMVFYSLTPQGFRRYSSSNLCPALSSPGRQSRRANGGGTLLVNRAEASFIESRKRLHRDISRQEGGETPPRQPPGWRRYARTRRHARTRSFRCSN